MSSIRIFIAGLLLMVSQAIASAAPDQNSLSVLNAMHISGGVGEEERNSLLAQRSQYNLHLTFAQARTGEYLTGVKVEISAMGKPQSTFETLMDCGPLLFVRLKPGVYRVTATYEGKSKSSLLRVRASGIDKIFYWGTK